MHVRFWNFAKWAWLFWSLMSAGLFCLLASSWGPLPALGPLLDLNSGIWRHRSFEWKDTDLEGLSKPVEVAIDQHGVPHIFAESEADLYRVQGYIVAAHRLFQMEVYSRSNVGGLSELVGSRGFKLDEFFVKFGMRRAELRGREALLSHPTTKLMVESFVDGANQYIHSSKEIPPEFKLLGLKPHAFLPQIVSGMSKTMSYSLSGHSSDLVLSQMMQTWPIDRVLDLFPEFLPPKYEDVVFPQLNHGKRRTKDTSDAYYWKTHIKDFPNIPRPPQFNGSNNWAIAPSRSATGHSILANDTHLGLTLPNVWFETQLSCPEFNVYGVGFANVPGIINGFNRNVAWGPTNGTTDVLDYYEVEFRDDTSRSYRDGERWLDVEIDRDAIRDRKGNETIVEVPWTKWGPVLHREGRYGLVARWTAHGGSNELLALRQLYAARTAKDCLKAFEGWHTPIQNFVCADADHIGMMHAGDVPVRRVGEGRIVEPPQATANGLSLFLEPSRRPQVSDPASGYLQSANQRIVGPTEDNYMGWSYEDPFRGRRIRQLIEEKPKLSGEDMIRIQNDDLDMEAAVILPHLLKNIDQSKLSTDQAEMIGLLQKWNYRALSQTVEPTLYKAWYQAFKKRVFTDDCLQMPEGRCEPKDMRMAWMLDRLANNPDDSDSYWIDDQRTPERESLRSVVTEAWSDGWLMLHNTLGADVQNWKWRNFNRTSLSHLARLPGFGSGMLEMDGAADSVRGNRGWHGAVYKFVIELGPKLRAWIQVPGGNSGDPFSPEFERFVKDWSEGKMRTVEFYRDLEEARRLAIKVVQFRPVDHLGRADGDAR